MTLTALYRTDLIWLPLQSHEGTEGCAGNLGVSQQEQQLVFCLGEVLQTPCREKPENPRLSLVLTQIAIYK